MAIADVKEYTHLTEEEVEQLGRELDAIRAEIEESRGAADAAYINRLIKVQRGLAAAGRVALLAGAHSRRSRAPALVAGAALLGLAKILENMEIGHNVMHGQWDWMNDPEIHSSNWEWDTAQPAEQWKHSPQLRPPPVHQRARLRQRHRLRHPADGARAEVAPRPTSGSRSTTRCSPRCSSGASPCTTSTSSGSARARRTRRR